MHKDKKAPTNTWLTATNLKYVFFCLCVVLLFLNTNAISGLRKQINEKRIVPDTPKEDLKRKINALESKLDVSLGSINEIQQDTRTAMDTAKRAMHMVEEVQRSINSVLKLKPQIQRVLNISMTMANLKSVKQIQQDLVIVHEKLDSIISGNAWEAPAATETGGAEEK
mmetsp:Transcript_7277/g.7993  ORF Transcript_7277/g.7993 Transcript_7277/m.7993 type:complete len:168 (-) Transcript_7277:9-512(-)